MTSKNDIGERVSRLEGGYEHLATKADVAALKADIVELKGDVDSRFARMEAQIAQLETRMFLRMGGLIIGRFRRHSRPPKASRMTANPTFPKERPHHV